MVEAVSPVRTTSPLPIARRSRFLLILAALAWLAAPRAADAAVIRGVVVDPDGRPVPGAQVLLLEARAVRSSVITDAAGGFRLERVGAGRYDIAVVLPGFQSDPVSLAVGPDDERDVRVPLHLSGVSESVVVSAAQVDVPLSRTADSISVMNAREIRTRQAEAVADVLRRLPGLALAQNGGRGSVTSIFPRGGESDFTMVLVDGVPANAFGGGVDLSQLSVAGLARVEVVRGPQSALFGSDAIGGVIQLVTRQGGRPRVEATLEGGSLGTSRASVSTSGSRGRWTWGGAVERMASGGFRGTAPATGEKVTNDDAWARHVSGAGGWHGEGGAEVRASGSLGWTDRGFPGPYGSNPIGAYTAVDRISRGRVQSRAAAVTVVQPFTLAGARMRQRTQVTVYDYASDFTSLFGLSRSGTRRLTARTQTDALIGASLRLTAGGELKRERASNTFITGDTSEPLPVRRMVAGVFAEADYQAHRGFSVTAGVRAEHIRRGALEGSASPYLSRPAFGADTVVSVNPKIAAAWLIPALSDGSRLGGMSTRVHATAGTGIRPPDALEIAFTDNPRLKPERSRSVEAGIEEQLAGGRAVVALTAFANRYDDLIVAVGPDLRDASRFRTDNISNARSRGLELAGSFRAGWGLEGRLSYTWLATAVLAADRAEGLAPAPFRPGDWLLRRPRHAAAADVAIVRHRVTAFLQVDARGRALDVEPTLGAGAGLFFTPGYGVVHAGGSVTLWNGVELTARVGNLFNRHYEETLGFPAPGRTAMIGVRVAAGR